MYQSGHLESDMWLDGFVDTHVWYNEIGLPALTSGSYDSGTFTITAGGTNFYIHKGSGALYYRKDSGSWVEVDAYLSWNNEQIKGLLVAALDYGSYDLRMVRDDAEESVLIGAFSVLPGEPSEYYVDAGAVAPGSGTEADPWDLSQLKAYFEDDVGYFPTDGDIVNVKGDIPAELVDSYLFLVGTLNGVTITVRAWDKAVNGMFTISMPSVGLEIFRIDNGSSDVTLILSGAAILVQDDIGSAPSDDIIIKSLDNTVGVNKLILRGCMILSEYDLHMTGDSGIHKTDVDIYGSNISIKNAILHINDYTDTVNVYDSAVNLAGTASITDSGGALTWTRCEFNVVSASIPGTATDCVFESQSLALMPSLLEASEFYENDFNYMIYGLSSAGGGATFWLANGISDDIRGATRSGIGAFRFTTGTYYVDGEKSISGTGVESDQFTLNQFRNYFDSSVGNSCNISPTGYDTFMMTNIFKPIDNFFVQIGNEIGGHVMIKSADIGRDKAWFIETEGNK